jgi:DNA-binding transcriptional LysR family regulator
MAPSTLSRQIRERERAVGVRWLQHITSRVELTLVGDRFLKALLALMSHRRRPLPDDFVAPSKPSTKPAHLHATR